MKTRSSYPKVSIVIPVYNGSNYLKQAIDSALEQNYPNTEVIVVNDGSRDNGLTEAICKQYGEKIRYFYKENGGVSSALNFGIQEMTGQYFSWLSHDDLYYQDKIGKQVEYIRENPAARIVCSGLDVIDSNGEKISSYKVRPNTKIRNGRKVLDTWVYGCSLIIDKKVFDEVALFNPNNKTIQDIEMWLDIVSHGIPIYFMEDILCQCRKHPECGSLAGRSEHLIEVDMFFSKLIDRYSLPFFSQDGRNLHWADIAEIYEWLGDQAKQRGALRSAKHFYLLALVKYPNIFKSIFRQRFKKYYSHLTPGNPVKET